jgi:hypothetical protein
MTSRTGSRGVQRKPPKTNARLQVVEEIKIREPTPNGLVYQVKWVGSSKPTCGNRRRR